MLASHPYFFANLPLLAAVCLFLILGRRGQLARLALYSGLACLPCSLVAVVHGNYWRPARLGGGPIGVEDLIFTFTSGAAVWPAGLPTLGFAAVPEPRRRLEMSLETAA